MAPKGARRRPAPAIDHREADSTLHRKLVQCGTKTGLINCMQALTDAGWLTDAVLHRTQRVGIKRRLTTATSAHCDALTPYGRVVQRMKMPFEILPYWEFVHPMALIHYLCSISIHFFKVMDDCISMGEPLQLIIYIDEIVPGNPLRPEKARTLQAIYWAFSNWPQHVLQRTNCWPTFGTIRSTLIEKLPGGISALMKFVLRVFFAEEGHSFSRGVSIAHGGACRIVCAVFAGFLADEKAHNQVADSKGASGTKPCKSCRNCYARVLESTLPDGCVSIRCTDHSKFVHHTDASVYECYDALAACDNVADRKELQQLLGIKYNPDGMMSDPYTRQLFKPVSHTIRDWMHMLVSNGVANIQTARLLNILTANKVTLIALGEFIESFNLPYRHGKTSAAWVARKRLGKKKEELASFAGLMLSIVPILACYVTETIGETNKLYPHVVCYNLLHTIIGILSFGPTDTLPYAATLRDLLQSWAPLFIELYPAVSAKPKFHNFFEHMVDDMIRIGKNLSCFVTERKHRTTKRTALFVFRHIDNTVIKGMLNRQCESLLQDGESLFCRKSLTGCKTIVVGGQTFKLSKQALLPCGSVRRDDVVWLIDRRVGKVLNFWATDLTDVLIVQLMLYSAADDNGVRWNIGDPVVTIVDTESIIDAVIWAALSPSVIRVIPPIRSTL